jgi:hypothetical protein
MSYGRVRQRWDERALDDADVSHMAELAGGDFFSSARRPPHPPFGHLLPKVSPRGEGNCSPRSFHHQRTPREARFSSFGHTLPLSPSGRGREAMTYGRVRRGRYRHAFDGAAVSHSAELVRGGVSHAF